MYFTSSYLVEPFPIVALSKGLKFQAVHFPHILMVAVLFSSFLLVNLDHFVLKSNFLPDSAVVCMVNLRDGEGAAFYLAKI